MSIEITIKAVGENVQDALRLIFEGSKEAIKVEARAVEARVVEPRAVEPRVVENGITRKEVFEEVGGIEPLNIEPVNNNSCSEESIIARWADLVKKDVQVARELCKRFKVLNRNQLLEGIRLGTVQVADVDKALTSAGV